MMTEEQIKYFINRILNSDIKKEGQHILNEKLPCINLPLYKYCGICEKSKRTEQTIDFNIDNFENDVLYFQNPAAFNDPFDCYLGFSQAQVIKDLLVGELKRKHQYTPQYKKFIAFLFDNEGELNDLNGLELFDENPEEALKVLEQAFSLIRDDNIEYRVSKELVLSLAENNFELFKKLVNNQTTILDQKQLINDLTHNDAFRTSFINQYGKEKGEELLEIARREMIIKIETDPDELFMENPTEPFSLVSSLLNFCLMIGNQLDSPGDVDTIKEKLNEVSIEALSKSRQFISNSIRITCLSEKMDSPLMWSHYANKHYGFCVEYDFTSTLTYYRNDLLFAQLMLFPVQYSKERPLFSKALFNSKTKLDYLKNKMLPPRAFEQIIYGLLCKSSDWSYEKEWRIIQLNGKDTMKLPKARKIFLGANIEKEAKERLTKIAQKKRIPVFQMFLSPDKYKFDYYRIL